MKFAARSTHQLCIVVLAGACHSILKCPRGIQSVQGLPKILPWFDPVPLERILILYSHIGVTLCASNRFLAPSWTTRVLYPFLIVHCMSQFESHSLLLHLLNNLCAQKYKS